MLDHPGSVIRGVVRALDGPEAIVEVEQGGCGRCHEKGGCGGQHLTQMFCSGQKSYRVANSGGAVIGESVTIAVAAGSVRRSANLAYVLPLLCLVAGAVLGMQLAGDTGAMAGGAIGLVQAWLVARLKLRPVAGNAEIGPCIVPHSH